MASCGAGGDGASGVEVEQRWKAQTLRRQVKQGSSAMPTTATRPSTDDSHRVMIDRDAQPANRY